MQSRHRGQPFIVNMPAGTVATTQINADRLRWLGTHTRPGDFFFQADWAGLYLPLSLRHPSFIDVLENRNLTRPEYVELTIQELKAKEVKYILWLPRLETPDLNEGPAAYHLSPFKQFLYAHYHHVWTFSNQDEMWERNDFADRRRTSSK